MTSINNNPPSGLPGLSGMGLPIAVKDPVTQGVEVAAGALGQAGSLAMGALMPFSSPLGDVVGRTAGLPPPRGVSDGISPPSVSGLALAAAKLDDSGTFSMLEITQLIYKTNKQARTVQRNDMVATLDAQAKLSENVAENMKSAAATRFTAAVVSSVVSMAGSIAAVGTASAKISAKSDVEFSHLSQIASTKAQAYSGFSQSISGVISAGGEVKATEYESENKRLESAISRMEKVYQESNSMLGDLKENMQLARDTIRALSDAQMSTRIAGNF